MKQSKIRPDLLQSSLRGVCAAFLLTMAVAVAADVKQTVAPGNVESPSLGYVTRTPAETGTLELRAMLGVPGAARFSEAMGLPEGTVSAEPAPGQGWVLAVRANEVLAFVPATGAAASIARIGKPASWAFSPSGERVALFYPDRGNVVLMSGLPGSPKLEQTVRVAQVDSFALSDNGVLAYAVGDQVLNSDGGLIYRASGQLAFEPRTDLLVLFDAASSQLMEVAAVGASSRVLATGITAVDQLLASASAVYVGDVAGGTVLVVAFSDGSITTWNVSVSKFVSTSIPGTVLVSFDTDQPAWLVNAQGVSFVPALLTQVVQ